MHHFDLLPGDSADVSSYYTISYYAIVKRSFWVHIPRLLVAIPLLCTLVLLRLIGEGFFFPQIGKCVREQYIYIPPYRDLIITSKLTDTEESLMV